MLTTWMGAQRGFKYIPFSHFLTFWHTHVRICLHLLMVFFPGSVFELQYNTLIVLWSVYVHLLIFILGIVFVCMCVLFLSSFLKRCEAAHAWVVSGAIEISMYCFFSLPPSFCSGRVDKKSLKKCSCIAIFVVLVAIPIAEFHLLGHLFTAVWMEALTVVS